MSRLTYALFVVALGATLAPAADPPPLKGTFVREMIVGQQMGNQIVLTFADGHLTAKLTSGGRSVEGYEGWITLTFEGEYAVTPGGLLCGVFTGINQFTHQGEDSFYHWVTKIIEHRFLDQVRALRRKKRDAAREVAFDPHQSSRHQAMLDRLMPDFTTASRVMRRQDAVGAMLLCMAKLPDEYRQAIQRIYLDEEPIKQVATDMGKTEDALRRLAGRAVERLAACMGHASRYLSNAG